MAHIHLTDGTTILKLMDTDGSATTYRLKRGEVDWGVPDPLRAEHGNILRNSWGFTGFARGRRSMRLPVAVSSGTPNAVTTALNDLEDAFRAARQWAQFRVGNRWYVEYDLDGTNIYQITVQDGQMTPDPGGLGNERFASANPLLRRMDLTMDCDPFWRGTEETVENYAADPSFEVAGTALADHTEDKTATGTTARDTTKYVYGAASLKLVMTDSGAGQQWIARRQDVTVVAAEVWSVGVHCEATALSDALAALQVQVLDSAGNVLWEDDDFLAAVSTAGVASLLSRVAITIPTGGVTLRCWWMLRSVDVDATGTAYFDAVMTRKAATLPTAWISGRAVKNHFDDDGQAHLSYIDIHPNAGDAPAMVQIKISEDQAHTSFWAGARQDGRQYDGGIWHEGEDFGAWEREPTSGSESGGAYGEWKATPVFDAASEGTLSSGTSKTVPHTIGANGLRRVLYVWVQSTDAVQLTGVTYNAIAMTLIGTAGSLKLWRLIAPATGANDIVASWSASQTSGAIVTGVSVDAADQTTPNGTVLTDTGGPATTTGNQDVTSVAEDLVLGGIGLNAANAITLGGGQTQRFNSTVGSRSLAGGTKRATGSTTNMSGTFSSALFQVIALAVKGDAGTAAAPVVVTKSVSTPPRGAYQVLARLRNPDAAAWGVAMGSAYGGITNDPSVAGDYATIAASETGWHWLDIGTLIVPPQLLPDGATLGTLTLRLAFYRSSGTGDQSLDCDAVKLLPVDFGTAFVSKASAADVITVDSITPEGGVTLWDASDVFQSRPTQDPSPIEIDPDGGRVYFIFDDGAGAPITDGAKVKVRIIPLVVQPG